MKAHEPGLDTLRAAAILMVMPFHAWNLIGSKLVGTTAKEIVRHGWAGVDLFFLLSGFLIGAQLFRSVKQDGRVNIKRFYLKRSLRILPSFYVVLLLYYLWPAFVDRPIVNPLWEFLTFTMNYDHNTGAFSHAWSLCVEEHFYLVFPSLVALAAWRPKLLRPTLVVPLILLVEVGVRFYLWSEGAAFSPNVYRPSHTHLDGLTVGVALALIREYRPDTWSRLCARPWLLLVVGLGLVGSGMWMYQNLEAAFPYTFCFTAMAFGFGALVVASVAPGFWLAIKHVPGAAWTASLAFTMYLVHKPMIHLATVLVEHFEDQKIMTNALAAVMTVAIAMAIHYGVEQPCLRFRDRWLASCDKKIPDRRVGDL